MPLVRPFRGLLYSDSDADAMARVLAPPFDMINGDQQRALFGQSEHNIARLTVADDGPGYPGVADRFAAWKRSRVLRRDPEAAFYVYEQRSGDARLRGFLGAVQLGDPAESGVYPMRATDCALEPVFGLYSDATGQVHGVLDQAVSSPPMWEAQTTDGAMHRLWRVTDDAELDALRDTVAPCRAVIADGHHRWAAANAYRCERRESGAMDPNAPHEYGFVLLVDARTGGVRCGAFHRVVLRLPDGVSPTRLPELLGPHFDVREFPTDDLADEIKPHALLIHVRDDGRDGPVFGCQWKGGAAIVRVRDLEALLPTATREIDPIIQDFDVALLHRLILKPRLRCRGDYSPQACAVVFEKDPVVAWQRVASDDAVMAWYVNPATTEAVMRAAFAGHTVPQKATHFYPKPPSGMVMYEVG